MHVTSLAETILSTIDARRGELVDFLQGFVRTPTSNPPGDTRYGAAYLENFLKARELSYQVIAPMPEMPNLLASWDTGRPGRHLVLNGHIDVFPPGRDENWRHGGPWSGSIEGGRLYGRGTADMKCGTIASFATYAILHELRDTLSGRLTLTAVSDEETGGTWGTGYLFKYHRDKVAGDCCLNGEPSSAYTVRYGEKTPHWLVFTVRTRGAHGAYVHMSASANKIAARLMAALESLTQITADMPAAVARNLADPSVRKALDDGLGKGAADLVPKVTLNIGIVDGGLKTNMIPSSCKVEADIRLPVGVSKVRIRTEVESILKDFPEVTVEEVSRPKDEANWCDPNGEMLRLIQAAAERVAGICPVPVITLAATDARFWRLSGVPAYIYGCSPDRMGTYDESVDVEEFLNVVRVHALAAAAYMEAQGA
jgi:succinyl-diaminopimelate desuccinylase